MKNIRSLTPLSLPHLGAASALAALLASAIPSSAVAASLALTTDAPTGNFGDTIWLTGATVGGPGPGTAAAASGDALFFDTSTTTSLTNNLSGATFAGFTFNSDASAYTIGGNAFTLSGGITNGSATSLQTFGALAAITLSSAVHTFSSAAGGLTINGNITTGAGINGNINFTGGGTTTLAGTNSLIISPANFGSVIVQNSSTLAITGATTISGTTQNGGTFQIGTNAATTNTVTIASGASLTLAGSTNATQNGTYIGQQSTGVLTLNGGTLSQTNTGTNFIVGNTVTNAASGTLNINASSLVTIAGAASGQGAYVLIGRQGATGTINLNGGVLETGRTFGRNGGDNNNNRGTANFNFNGGTLRALANNSDWLNSTTRNDVIGTSELYAMSATTVQAGGARIDSNGFDVGINTVLAHDATLGVTPDGGLTKSGAGMLTLGAANTYTGATTINGGTLALGSAGSIESSSGVVINGSGAKLLNGSSTAVTPAITLTQGTLTGTGTANAVTVGNGTGGVISNNNGAAGAALTINSLTFNGAATVNLYSNGASTTADLITTTLATNAAGQVTLNAANTGWVSGSTYNLISYGGGSIGGNGFAGFSLGTVTGLGARQSGILGNSGTALTLAIGGDTPEWTGAQNSQWTTATIGGASNWKLQIGGTPTNFLPNDAVLFNDNASVVNTTVNIAENVAPASVTFANSSHDYTISSTGGFGITSGSVAKSGTGTTTISTANSYNGGTTVNAGTLILSGNNTFGTGGVTVNGGTATLSGANAYTGTTAVNGGTLNVNNDSAIGTGTLTITGGTIDNTSGGALVLSTNNAQNWNGDFTFGGTNALNLGTGAVTLGATPQVTVTANTLTVGGVISGSFGLTKAGAGTLLLTGANTYTGTTTINGGTLQLGDGVTNGSITTSSDVIDNGALVLNVVGTGSYGGIISGSGTVTKTGTGTFTSGAVHTFTGGLVVNDGTFALLNNGSNFGAGSVTLGDAATANNVKVTFTNFGRTFANAFTSQGNGGTNTIQSQGNGQAFTFSGPVTLASGATASELILNTAGAQGNNSDTMTFTGGFTGTGNLTTRTSGIGTTGGGSIFLSGGDINHVGTLTNDGTGSSVVISAVIGTNVTTVTQNGTSGLVLSGANTYAGGTTVSAGTLTAGNATALGSGAVNINGGTLQTTVANVNIGSLTLSSGGTLTAINGISAGTLTLASNANFSFSDGTLGLDFSGNTLGTYDQILASGLGTFSITGGILDLTNSITDYTASYQILSGFASGSVAGLSISNYDTANWTASLSNAGVLTFAAVPEPSVVALMILGLGGLVIFRRRFVRG